MNEYGKEEEKLFNQLIPRITEYFNRNLKLEKGRLQDFLEFIDFTFIENNNLDLFWKEISKNSDNKSINKELLIKNLINYIHNHRKEIFGQDKSLMNNVTKFLERPVKLIEDIDSNNELMLEFYRLLATLDFDSINTQSISLTTLEKALNEYKFINLTKDSISEIVQELLKEKTDYIKKYDFLEIMENMSKEFQFKLEEIAERKLIFSDDDLDKPELNNFINLLTFINILLRISDSVIICYENSIKVIKSNEQLNAEYLHRNFFILVNNMKLYFYEIMRIYYEQKQKFEYFICANISKISILKQQNKDLSEQLKSKDDDDNDENILQALYEEIKTEKNKSEDLYKENQDLKKEIIKNNNQIFEYDNQIQKLNKIQKENEGTINLLNKEREIQKEKYKNVFDQLNALILNNKEKEKKLKESVKRMNLSNNLLHLVTMDKADIISLFNEKDKYYGTVENKNKELKNKIAELEKELQKRSEAIEELKNKNDNLNKKNEILQKEIEDSKKEIEEQTEKSFFLNSIIDDKVDKEDYDNLEHQLNEEKAKNIKMKKNIDNLNEEISKKEETLIKNKNQINSQKQIIKENEKKINDLNEQINKKNEIYNELSIKYNDMISKIEDDKKNLNNAIENLNLSEKYKKFINFEKPDLIKVIIEKDDYLYNIEKENLKNIDEIKDLKNKNQDLNNDINRKLVEINNLTQKKLSLENELNEVNTEKSKIQKILNNKEEELNKEKEIKEKLIKDLNEEKNKNELMMNDNKNMKNEIITQKENISKLNNEISLLQNKNKEKEEQINSLTKDKETLNKNYKDLLDKYNEELSKTKQKEQRTSIAIKNLNLTGEHLKLANMNKEQLISLIVEKDKYIKVIEDLNKDLNEKVNKITKEKNIIIEENNKLKESISNLEKNNSLINSENEQFKKDIENIKSEKNNLILDLEKEKELKEKYIKEVKTLTEEIKELKERINLLKADIQKISDLNTEKEEKIISLNNEIASMQNKINSFEKQKEELLLKYNNLIEQSNIQLEKIQNLNLKEKTELDLISKLNLENKYQYLAIKSKADLISLFIEKDVFNTKLEQEKNEMNNTIINLEKNKIQNEKNLAEFEAKNNTLNNKIKNLENELNDMKNENENIKKEKNEISNLLKEEKKMAEKMKSANDVLNKENIKIEILNKENKKLNEEITNQKDIITKYESKINLQKKNLEENDIKIQNLSKELDTLNSQYKNLLNKYNSQNIILQNKSKAKEEFIKSLEEKYKYLKDLTDEELIKLIIEKEKLYQNSKEDNNNIKKENLGLNEKNKKLEDYLNKAKDLKKKYQKLVNEYKESEKNNEIIMKERDDYKNKHDKLLESIIKKDKEAKIFKSSLLAQSNASKLFLKKIAPKVKKNNLYLEEKSYDYLCLRLKEEIIGSLKDSIHDGITVFSDSIKYIDEHENSSSDCILFITMEYFYFYNWKYQQCLAKKLVNLKKIIIYETSNYISFFFKNENVVLETFRVLELINFMKLIQAKQKTFNFSIKMEKYIHILIDTAKNDKNFLNCLYYGKALFSGSFSKEKERIFTVNFEERFGVLCDIGLIIFESPTGKPKGAINLLFAELGHFNTSSGDNGLIIEIKDQRHKFIFENKNMRDLWEDQIIKWKQSYSLLTKFN